MMDTPHSLSDERVDQVIAERLLNLNPVADHPELKLLQALLPPELVPPHPVSVLRRIRDVNDDANELIVVENAGVSPMAFDWLGFLASCAEVFDDFEDRLDQPLSWHEALVVEPQRKQHLEAPPSALHTTSCP
jgi:hypothetical protein